MGKLFDRPTDRPIPHPLTHSGRLNLTNELGNSGKAMATCINCSSRTFDTQWISCDCPDASKTWYRTSLDLSECQHSFVFFCSYVSADRLSRD
jgi:hypothetical protein